MLLGVLTVCSVYAQNVNVAQMTEEQRQTYLISTAKTACKKFPNFYRENAVVSIEKQKAVTLTATEASKVYNNPKSPWYGMKAGEIYYSVTFRPCNNEKFEWGFAACVDIRENTGKAFEIQLGNGFIYPVK